jgi:membrane dipeptidase
MPSQWFDSHLDLAYLAVSGRDMTATPQLAGGPDLPAAVTIPSLAAGNVRAALATIFIEPTDTASNSPATYQHGNIDAANAAALAQLDTYHDWEHRGLIDLGLGTPPDSPLRVGILIEGADAVRDPQDLPWWVERGVVAIGLTWARSSRYAAGNAVDPATDPGLSDLGRAMIRAMDSTHARGRSIVHDASHLSDRSLCELFEATDQLVIASHSNCRALIAHHPAPTAMNLQRHLADDSIREIDRRGGIIGLNLYSPFIIPGAPRDRRATIDQWCDHADHIAQLLGHHHAIGLGSDMDGGFSADRLPEGVSSPRDLEKLAQALSSRGWTHDAIDALAWRNWSRFWEMHERLTPPREP